MIRSDLSFSHSSRLQPSRPLLVMAVLKNLTNLFVLGGDYYFYGRTYNMVLP